VLLTPGNASSLAIHAHALTDATVLHVARLASGQPVQSAKIFVNGEAVRGRTTDEHGVVALPMGLERLRGGGVRVDDGQCNSALSLLGSETPRCRTYLPEFANDATIRSDDRRGMLNADRGIYRACSTVFIKASLRKKQGQILMPV